jgi:CubicO group peptidase (beta-lactamase class C family)
MLIALGLFSNATAIFAQFGTKTVKLDKNKFVQSVQTGFGGKVKGYQAVLLKNGQIVAETAGGEARTKIDGKADMTLNTPSNIGSTAKFFAGVALLKFFQNPKNNLNPTGKTVEQWLDTKIFSYLPEIWQANAHPSWKQVTFRELLQHKSGVRGITTAEKNAFVAQGYRANSPFLYFLKELKPENRGVRDYENFNFTILTFLLPMVASQTLHMVIDQNVVKQKLKADDLSITQAMGNAFYGHMLANSFGKVTPKINPSCDAPNEYPAKKIIYAMAYDSVSDTGKGFDYSERLTNGSCFAQGGWYVSGRELAAFVANFAASEVLVSNETRDLMIDEKNASNNMVWSTTYAPTKWIADNLSKNRMPAMDGLQEGSRSVLIKMPGNYYALAIINSADMQPSELAKILLDSFSDSASL